MYLLVIDQGTSSSRVILYNTEFQIVAKTQIEVTPIYPQPGWVEHDPIEILNNIILLISQCLDTASELLKLDKNRLVTQIIGLGITNQRETTVVWDKHTGKPIHNAIVWQDRRTIDFCENLKKSSYEATIHQKTGLLIDPYFSATKINWILKKYDLFNNKNILFGTIDCYLIWHLTHGKSHVTDSTNASRTQLFNINTLEWDDDLLEIFNIPKSILPFVKNSADNFGEVKSTLFNTTVSHFIPILGVAGDQQAAAIGQQCIAPSTCKITYGTGCFVLQHTGTTPIFSKHKLITTLAYCLNNKPSYALEGSIFVAGAAVQWLRDAVKLIARAEDSENIAKELTNNHGVYLVPAFTGLGAPYWDPEARGAIMGLTRETGFAHIVRAALESVCYQTKDLLSAFEADYGLPSIIKVDGGMTANNWLLQFLSDITRLHIEKPADLEATAKGAAVLTALGGRIIESVSLLPANPTTRLSTTKSYYPIMPEATSLALYQGWCKAVARLLQK